MNDSRDVQDTESVRNGHSHVASQPVSFPPHPVPGGMLSRSIGMPSRKNGPPSIWDTHGISGNVFANPAVSSSAPYPKELNPWSSNTSEQIHSSQAVKNDQSGPSAKNSVIPREVDSSKNYGADQQTTPADLRSSSRQIPHASNIRLLEDKIQGLRYVLVHNYLRKLCCGSKKWSWLIQRMI